MRHMVTDSFKDTVKMPEINCDDDEDDEDGYFTGYAHFSIHHDMLSVLYFFSLTKALVPEI